MVLWLRAELDYGLGLWRCSSMGYYWGSDDVLAGVMIF